MDNQFDSVLCLNVLEYLEEPGRTLEASWRCLKPGGRLLLLVPRGKALYGSLDRTLGHRQRFSPGELSKMLEGAGFRVERVHNLNKVSTPVWWLHSRVLRSRQVAKPTLKVFDKTVWLWELIDPLLPWPGLTTVVVARKPPA
jgi:SAM-dependent methyltransferase